MASPAPGGGSPFRPRAMRTGRKFPVGTAIIALVVVLVAVGALFAFSGAKVIVTPATNTVSVTGTFVATLGGGELSYELVTVDKIATKSVPAESEETVDVPAQGSIVISNRQDAPQALIKNTRFQTPDGLVFRIRDSITVPAAKNGTPGTLTVTVYADEAGERYNVGATTFTLPGLAGSNTFELVDARSTDSMKGGFSGTRPTVAAATKERESSTLEAALADEMRAALDEKVPEGYVLVPGGIATVYEDQPDTSGAAGTVDISVKATAIGVMFPEEALARAIAYQVVGTYSGEPLSIKDPNTLTLVPANGALPDAGGQEFPFTLSGETTLLWKVEAERIAGAVAGKTRESAENILQSFPEVERALLVVKPFWSSKFPSDPAKITVTIEAPAE